MATEGLPEELESPQKQMSRTPRRKGLAPGVAINLRSE